MTALWILLAFWSGGCTGYVLYTAMQMARHPTGAESQATLKLPAKFRFGVATRRWT